MVTNRQDIKQLGTIMCVFAHPDDETFTMGGIMAAALKNGQRVICVTATRGELGLQDEKRWPAEQLGDIRTSELKAALHILGVGDLHLFDYSDGGCSEADSDEAVAKLSDLLNEYKPDTVMTFGPDGMTGHPDHVAVSAWALRACTSMDTQPDLYWATLTREQYVRSQAVAEALNFYYNTPKPPVCEEAEAAICLHLDDELLELKEAALRSMPSQYQIMFESFDADVLRGCFDVEAFVRTA